MLECELFSHSLDVCISGSAVLALAAERVVIVRSAFVVLILDVDTALIANLVIKAENTAMPMEGP
jgi:hypothetical protein